MQDMSTVGTHTESSLEHGHDQCERPLTPSSTEDTNGPVNSCKHDDDGIPSASQWHFTMVHDNENARHVLPGHQETLWQCMKDHEDAGQPYAPWSLKAEWELVQWLSMSQLS